MIKSFWIPGLSLRDPCKSRVSSVYAQILVLAIWYVIGVTVFCCVVIYTSEMMHDYQGVGSRAGILFCTRCALQEEIAMMFHSLKSV